MDGIRGSPLSLFSLFPNRYYEKYTLIKERRSHGSQSTIQPVCSWASFPRSLVVINAVCYPVCFVATLKAMILGWQAGLKYWPFLYGTASCCIYNDEGHCPFWWKRSAGITLPRHKHEHSQRFHHGVKLKCMPLWHTVWIVKRCQVLPGISVFYCFYSEGFIAAYLWKRQLLGLTKLANYASQAGSGSLSCVGYFVLSYSNKTSACCSPGDIASRPTTLKHSVDGEQIPRSPLI